MKQNIDEYINYAISEGYLEPEDVTEMSDEELEDYYRKGQQEL